MPKKRHGKHNEQKLRETRWKKANKKLREEYLANQRISVMAQIPAPRELSDFEKLEIQLAHYIREDLKYLVGKENNAENRAELAERTKKMFLGGN